MATRERSSSKVVRALRNGQVTIPIEFRRALQIDDDSLLRVSLEDGELRIRPVASAPSAQGSPWLRELYDMFAPVREEAMAYSEEEINAAIDEAVAEVRRRRRV